MISHCGRWRAASSAPACAMAAVSEKLPAAITPTSARRAAASIWPYCSPVNPDVPITTATRRSIAAIAFSITARCDV